MDPAAMIMSWFLPLAAAVAYLGSRTALDIHRREGGRRGASDGFLMLALAWFPLLAWIAAQFTTPTTRHP